MKSARLRSLLAAFLVFSIAACGDADDGASPETPSASGALAKAVEMLAEIPVNGTNPEDPSSGDPTDSPSPDDHEEETTDPSGMYDPAVLAPASYPSGPPNYPSSPGADLKVWIHSAIASDFVPAFEAYEQATGATLAIDVGDNGLDPITEKIAEVNYDVVIGFDWEIAEVIWQGEISPIDYQNQAERFYPAAINSLKIGEAYYGVPLNMMFPVMVRNTKHVPEAPETFAELLDGLSSDFTQPVLIDTVPSFLYALHSSMGVAFAPDGSTLEEISQQGISTEGADDFINWLIPTVEAGDLLFVPPENEGGAILQIQIDETAAYITDFFVIDRLWGFDNPERYVISPIPAVGDKPPLHVIETLSAYIGVKADNGAAAQDFIFNYLTTDDFLIEIAPPTLPTTYSANVKYAEQSNMAYAVEALAHTASNLPTRKAGFPTGQWIDFVDGFTTDTFDALEDWDALLADTNRALRGD